MKPIARVATSVVLACALALLPGAGTSAAQTTNKRAAEPPKAAPSLPTYPGLPSETPAKFT